MKVELADRRYMPVRGSEYSAGFDLCACINPAYVSMVFYEEQMPIDHKENRSYRIDDYSIALGAGQRILVKTGIKVAIDDGYYGRIAPRSGLAYKNGIDVLAGVIDSDYRGDVGVILLNTSNTTFVIKNGDRIAQLVIEKIYTGGIDVVQSVADILPTARGEGGFGSTGTMRLDKMVTDEGEFIDVEIGKDIMQTDDSYLPAMGLVSIVTGDIRLGRIASSRRDKDPGVTGHDDAF
jgi:dUTP pyrophosphatase